MEPPSLTVRSKRTMISRKFVPASYDSISVKRSKQRQVNVLSKVLLAALVGASFAQVIRVFFGFENLLDCKTFFCSPFNEGLHQTSTNAVRNDKSNKQSNDIQIPSFLTCDFRERDGKNWIWGTKGCGLQHVRSPSVKVVNITTDVTVFNDRELPRMTFSKVRRDKFMSADDIANVRVAVLPVNSALNCCLEYQQCKTSLGGWDFTLQLHFLQRGASVSEADFLYVPFHHFCYNDKKKCTGRTIKELVTMELVRAQTYLRENGREDLPMIVPMSHDFGACARFHYFGYSQENYTYFEPLRNTIVLSPNADFDEDCFDVASDIVVPAFAHYPTFVRKDPMSLRATFGDVNSVKKSSDRQIFVFAGFSERFSQRKPGVRPWLMTQRNWRSENVRLNKASKFETYIEALNNTMFCLSPPGVVGWTGRLWDQLYAGCIPVIIAEKTLYPFEDRFDYNRFSLRFGFDDLERIEDKLLRITPQERDRLQAEGMKVREQFVWPRVDELHLSDRLHTPNAIDNLVNELAYAKRKLHQKRKLR
eukprot:Plantae.Rhodophyta-Purpureofilum_apyrenoidigerum.ctg20619.p1 GENE.Plantae.Rhodophyta-Purpureofilum_apyrenoidigerum.ctg20619~~Plantae.Rhodophyta-Purpureofilum_apyrenoidigerum.ctg20619.p1  ORF type:complete len:534 (+),score=83.06 Plantae.Rhodophyta-Purpureofilum_apyrenoidigerum.ctg20619:89-1690(+)